jgi:hypothetical protein
MFKRRGPPSQGWLTFLRNHAPDIAAMDFFAYHPTIIVEASTIRPSRNVSGSVVSERDPPICEFFPKKESDLIPTASARVRRLDCRGEGLVSRRKSAGEGEAGARLDQSERPSLVESRCGAVALGCTYLLPPLSSGGALVV